MDMLLRYPHGFVRRHLSKLERGLVAAALAGLLYLFLRQVPVYPVPWEMVIATAVFCVMIWSPAVAFFLAVVAVLYPLYSISLYLAVLFLAIALLGQRVFINHMGATLLVLATPWLAQVHLGWLALLMGGLMWGKSAGAWMGGLAGLWTLLLVGMTGGKLDWMLISGQPLNFQYMIDQFSQAGSLETLKLIATPLAPDPTLLLYHLLQIVVWAMVAGLVGGLAERAWPQHNRPFGNMLLAAGGATVLAAGHLWLAYWLQQYPTILLVTAGPSLALDALSAVLVVSTLEGLRDFIEHPLPTRQAWSAERLYQSPETQRAVASAGSLRARLAKFFKLKKSGQVSEPAQATNSDLPTDYIPLDLAEQPPKIDRKKQPPDDLIKIELD